MNPFLYVAQTSTPLGSRLGGPHEFVCAICGLIVDAESPESMKINALRHVGRVHELEYVAATGNAPTEAWLKHQEYLVREGFQ